jgi:FAD:protein FMN transferase
MLGRRRFLVAAISGATCAGAGALLAGRSPGLREIRGSSKALGANVSILALHHDESLANEAIGAAFREIELIESVMSLYRADSQLCMLNAGATLKSPHAYLVLVLEHAQRVARESGGAFDVTVQPLWTLFSEAKTRGALPNESEIAAARAKIGFQKIGLSPQTISLEPGMQLTLNGIAQGFAVDRAITVLRSFGIQHALIDTGEYGSLGQNSEQGRWTVGIQHPRKPDALSARVRLAGRCLSTSGDYATTFSADFSKNHIFDPRTGSSPGELSSVSVLAQSGMDADALSTAVFVLGAEKGFALLQAHNAEALIIRKDGSTFTTPGFQNSIIPA